MSEAEKVEQEEVAPRGELVATHISGTWVVQLALQLEVVLAERHTCW